MRVIPTKLFYEFGEFRLDTEKHRLLRDGEIVAVTPKAVETLTVLIQNRGRLVERDDLMNSVWRDATVEPGNLDVTISKLRKALGEDGDGRKYIETVPRLGYKFVVDVREVVEEVPALIVEKQTSGRIVIEEEIRFGRKPATLPLLPSANPRRNFAVLIGAVVIVAVGLFAYFRPWKSNPPIVSANISSIAVLPFKLVDTQNGNSHQGLGLADVLITRLSHINRIKVRPTSAVSSFENTQEDSLSIARKLQVDAVLEGTIYRAADKVRVTGRLLKVADQSTIWSGQFERLAVDELQLQNEIALQVVDALALNLSGSEQRALTKRYTESADAYELYLKGRYNWNKRNHEGLAEAERLFRNAIEKDPNFALAYVGLADSMIFHYRRLDTVSAFMKALELDPNLAEAYATKGFYQTVHEWQWQEAEANFRKSIELNPGYSTAHHWYAVLLEIEGRNDEAKAEMQRALEINPLSYNFLADLGEIYYFNHEYDKAKEYCNKALEIYPDFAAAHGHLYRIYLQTGEYDAAMNEYKKQVTGHWKYTNQSTSETEGRQGLVDKEIETYRQGGIREFLKQRMSISPASEPSLHYGAASSYVLLGEREKALDSLEKALEARGFMMAWVKADPVFDILRSEPRYQAILKKMGL